MSRDLLSPGFADRQPEVAPSRAPEAGPHAGVGNAATCAGLGLEGRRFATYPCRVGDTWESVAATATGDPSRSDELRSINPFLEGELEPCDLLAVPPGWNHGALGLPPPPGAPTLASDVASRWGWLSADVDGIMDSLRHATPEQVAQLQEPSELAALQRELERALNDDDVYRALRLLGALTSRRDVPVRQGVVDAAVFRIRDQAAPLTSLTQWATQVGSVYLAVTDLRASERLALWTRVEGDLAFLTAAQRQRLRELCEEPNDVRVVRQAMVWATQEGGASELGMDVAAERGGELVLDEHLRGRGTARSALHNASLWEQLPRAHRTRWMAQMGSPPLDLARWRILDDPADREVWFAAMRSLPVGLQPRLVQSPQLRALVPLRLGAPDQSLWAAYGQRPSRDAAYTVARSEIEDAWASGDGARVVRLVQALDATVRTEISDLLMRLEHDRGIGPALRALRSDSGRLGQALYGGGLSGSGDRGLALEGLTDPAGVGSVLPAVRREGEGAVLRKGRVAHFRQQRGMAVTPDDEVAVAHLEQRRTELSMVLSEADVDAVLDGAMGTPNLAAADPGAEADFMAAQIAAALARQGGRTLGVADLFTSRDRHADDAVARFVDAYGAVRGAGERTVATTELARLAGLHVRAMEALEAYAATRELVSHVAAQVAGVVGALAAIWATGGAALPFVLAASGTAGGAAAATADALVRERIGRQTVEAAALGGVEGVFAVVGGALAARVVRGHALGRSAGRVAVQAAGRATDRVGAGAARGLVEGMVDGAVGGAAGDLFVTALDDATWDQSTYRVLATLLAAAQRGAALGALAGGGFGAALGGAGSLIRRLGRRRGQVASEAWRSADLDARALDGLSEADADHLVRALALFELGAIAEGTEVLGRLGALTPPQRASLGRVLQQQLGGPPGGAKAVLAHPTDTLVEAARWVQPLPGVFDLVAHGTPDALMVLQAGSWVRVAADALPEHLAAAGYRGGPVRLIACDSGSDAVAGRLSELLDGAEVLAPTDVVYLHPGGAVTVGPDPAAPSGSWQTFRRGRAGASLASEVGDHPDLALLAGRFTDPHVRHFKTAYRATDELERFLRHTLRERAHDLPADFVDETRGVLDRAADRRRNILNWYTSAFREVESRGYGETGARAKGQDLWDESFAWMKELFEDPRWGEMPALAAARAQGNKLVQRQTRELVGLVKQTLDGERVAGLPVAYTGSFAAEPGSPAGFRGPQKAGVAVDADSDVDLYVVAPRLFRAVKAALPDVEGEKVMVDNVMAHLKLLDEGDRAIVLQLHEGQRRLAAKLKEAGGHAEVPSEFEGSKLAIRQGER